MVLLPTPNEYRLSILSGIGLHHLASLFRNAIRFGRRLRQSTIEYRLQGFWADITLVTPFATTFGVAAVAA